MLGESEKSLQMNDLQVSLDVKPELRDAAVQHVFNASERWFWRDR
jgi:hypothetical protein